MTPRSPSLHYSQILLVTLIGFMTDCNQPVSGPGATTAADSPIIDVSKFALLTPDSPQLGVINLAQSGGTTMRLGDVATAASDRYSVLRAVTPSEGGAATWYESLGASLFHGSRLDQVFVAGWNLAGNGTRIDTDDAAVGDQWESYYEQDTTNTWLERHWIYIDVNGNYFRPLSCQMGRTNDWTNCYVAADSFSIVDRNAGRGKGISYFRFQTQIEPPGGYLAVKPNATIQAEQNGHPWLLQLNSAGTTNFALAYLDSDDRVEVGVGSSGGGDAAGVIIGTDSSNNAVRGTLTVPHLVGGGVTPSCSIATGAGSPASCEIHGSDTAGVVVLNTGANTAPGPIVTIGFAKPYGAPPYVVIGAASGTAAAQMPFVDNARSTASSFVISSATGLGATNTFRINYIIAQ